MQNTNQPAQSRNTGLRWPFIEKTAAAWAVPVVPARATGNHLAAQNEEPEPGEKSVLAMTDAELIAAANQVAQRVAHSTLPIADAAVVIELSTRLIRRMA